MILQRGPAWNSGAGWGCLGKRRDLEVPASPVLVKPVLHARRACFLSVPAVLQGQLGTATHGESHSVVSNFLQPHGLYSPWNSPGQNTGVGSHSLLQGIFPTQGSNPGLPHCRRILYQLSHHGNATVLEWVAYPFSRGSS